MRKLIVYASKQNGVVEKCTRDYLLLGFAYTSDTLYYRQPKHLYQIPIMGRGRDPYVGLARKRPKTKWRFHWAENELITYIFAVQDICSILATYGSCYEVSAYNESTNSVYTHCCYGQDKMASRQEAKLQHQYIFAVLEFWVILTS